MSFGELCVLVIVGIVVIGPKDLPRFLRKAGQLAGKLRRMAGDVRAQSGIDEVLRSEGLTKDIAEIRRLAQGDFIEPIRSSLRAATTATTAITSAASFEVPPALPQGALPSAEFVVSREREYPTQAADSYAAIPDTAIAYAKGLPISPHAAEPLYVVGDANAPLPEPELLPSPELEASAPEAELEPRAGSDLQASDAHVEESSPAASLENTGTA